MRCDDDYAWGGGYLHGAYNPEASTATIAEDFLSFCLLAVRSGAVPKRWDWAAFLKVAATYAGCVPQPKGARRRVFGFQQRRWRAAERRHPAGHERMGSPTLQTLQDPILLLPWLCSRGGGFPNPCLSPTARAWSR
jgi:hypothetical protein